MTRLQIEATETALPLTYTVGNATGGVTGLTVLAAVRQGATVNSWLDFADSTFKTSGWTTRQTAVAEVDASNAPGVYRAVLNASAVVGVSSGDFWVVEYDASGGAPAATDVVQVVPAQADTSTLSGLLTQYVGTIQRYGPTLVRLPAITDSIHVGDVGVVINIPVIKAGELADLTGVTAVTFSFQAPESDTAVTIAGAVGTGSEVTVTTDATVFDVPGYWRIQAFVVWTAGVDELWTDIHKADVLRPVPIV